MRARHARALRSLGSEPSSCPGAVCQRFDGAIYSIDHQRTFAVPGAHLAELTKVLVSAFKVAWIDYYGRPEGDSALSIEVARPALAKFLVDKSREGITDEADLAAAGLQFLISLETADRPADSPSSEPPETPSWHLSGKATARFLVEGRVRLQLK